MTLRGICLFYTSSMAMRAEKVLKTAGFSVKLVPTPREVSSDCGIALQFYWDEREQVQQTLLQAGIEVAQLICLSS